MVMALLGCFRVRSLMCMQKTSNKQWRIFLKCHTRGLSDSLLCHMLCAMLVRCAQPTLRFCSASCHVLHFFTLTVVRHISRSTLLLCCGPLGTLVLQAAVKEAGQGLKRGRNSFTTIMSPSDGLGGVPMAPMAPRPCHGHGNWTQR